MIETYAGSSIRIGIVTDSNAGGRVSKSWAVHKFIRRMRNNDSISSSGSSKPIGSKFYTFFLNEILILLIIIKF